MACIDQHLCIVTHSHYIYLRGNIWDEGNTSETDHLNYSFLFSLWSHRADLAPEEAAWLVWRQLRADLLDHLTFWARRVGGSPNRGIPGDPFEGLSLKKVSTLSVILGHCRERCMRESCEEVNLSFQTNDALSTPHLIYLYPCSITCALLECDLQSYTVRLSDDDVYRLCSEPHTVSL